MSESWWHKTRCTRCSQGELDQGHRRAVGACSTRGVGNQPSGDMRGSSSWRCFAGRWSLRWSRRPSLEETWWPNSSTFCSMFNCSIFSFFLESRVQCACCLLLCLNLDVTRCLHCLHHPYPLCKAVAWKPARSRPRTEKCTTPPPTLWLLTHTHTHTSRTIVRDSNHCCQLKLFANFLERVTLVWQFKAR